jgi:hypothetical protein
VNINSLRSSELDAFVVGTVLGDSSIIKKKVTHTAYFKCSHCNEQKELLEFKKKILLQIHPVTVNIRQTPREDWQLNTNCLVYFDKLREKFYPNGTKKVTRELLNKLNPLGLAVWYMDDGQLCLQTSPKDRSKYLSRRARIWSLSFSYEEHLIIKQYFKEVWDIDIKIYNCFKKGGKKFYIEFNSTNFAKFREIIKDYIIPCMLYKIDLKYDTRYPNLYEKYRMDALIEKAKQLVT